MRFIDADALIKSINYSFFNHERVRIDTVTGTFLSEHCSPTIDAVEVVRCKKCKHSEPTGYDEDCVWCKNMLCEMPVKGFCSEGE